MAEPASEQSIFLNVLALPTAAERAAYLDEVCRDNPGLRAELEALLAAHERLGGVLPLTTGEEPAGGVAAESPPAPGGGGVEVGDVLSGRYKLLQQIGEGGMGTVWMAQQQQPVKRLVALKVIKPGMDSKQVLARFEAERQALALMDHPNIARVLDAGTTAAGRPYFVMELVKGVPITRYCDEHRLTPKERLELFIPVCQAIQHAHQKGIIHRDIKPSNVLVALYDGKPVPKVIDFGIAKATGQQLTEHTLVTGFGVVVGTLEYMSPEQAELNQLDIDTRSDIYSLGVLLYELLTGSTPLDKKRLKQAAFAEVLRIIREENPQMPSTRLSDSTDSLPSISAQRQTEPAKLTRLVRGELDWIVMKALEKDRGRRYETANGFAMDIQRYLADEPVQAGPPSVRYRLRKLVQRNKGATLAASVIIILLILGIAGTATGMVRALDAERRAIKDRDDKEAARKQAVAAAEAEAEARRQTRRALNTMTDEVLEDLLGRQLQLTDQHREFLKKVLSYHAAFAAATADDAEGRQSRAEGFHRVGHIRYVLGELQDAESAFRDALALEKQLAEDFPTRPDFRQELANSHNSLSHLLVVTGRPAEAEAGFRDAVALRKQLAADFPGQPGFRQEWADGLRNLGRLLFDTGRPDEGEAVYREALALRKQLAADFPLRPDFRQKLANSHNSLGKLLRATNRPEKAEAAYRDALALRKQLAADFPTQSEFQSELSESQTNLGNLFRDTRRPEKAEAAYRDALSLDKQLAADFPTRPDFRCNLAGCLNNLGILLRATNRPTEAEAAYKDALALYMQLAADFPTVSDYQNELAGTLTNLAILHQQRREFSAALSLLEQARPHHLAALAASPRNPTYRRFYRNYLLIVAESRGALNDYATVATTAEELARFGFDPAIDSYYAASFLCYSLTLTEKDSQLAQQRRQELAQNYTDRALALLQHAVARGFKDAARMKQDPNLKPLRAREEFRKLLADLEGKSKE
jgi:eukaryotic-like serine/threonine-protein kinase